MTIRTFVNTHALPLAEVPLSLPFLWGWPSADTPCVWICHGTNAEQTVELSEPPILHVAQT